MTSTSALWTELQEQGRATVGAFTVVGVSYLYTMESWWHAWQFTMTHLLVYAIAGLSIVLVLARVIGFHESQGGGIGEGSGNGGGGQGGGNGGDGQCGGGGQGGGNGQTGENDGGGQRDGDNQGDGGGSGRSGGSGGGQSGDDFGMALYETVVDGTEAVAQSFVASYLVLFLFGVLTLEDSPTTVARLGVFHVVPLGFGAALANDLFAGSDGEQPSRNFGKSVGVFALGAIFLSAPIALTQEMELIASYSGWGRLAALLVVTLLVTHLLLFELEMQGQAQRVQSRSKLLQVGHTFTVYLIGVAVAVALLAAFGHFDGQPVSVWAQETVVLAFPTSVGASAAQVVL